MKPNFYVELECVFNQFLKHHVKIQFNEKVGREDILKTSIRNEILHKINNNGLE